MRLGSEFRYAKSNGLFQRFYIWLFGMPILGLRIRAWRMLPVIKKYITGSNFILDFGSGRGVFTVQIAKQNPTVSVTGIDLIDYKIQDAMNVVDMVKLKNCHFETVDMFKKIFPRPVDAVIAIDVLEHIKDDQHVVKKIYSLLAENGKFIVHVPHYYRHLFFIKRINFDIEGHVRYGYLMPELVELMTQSGFKILESGYTYSSLETLANDVSYFITEGREKRKALYALFFPILLLIAWLGSFVSPKVGSGVYIVGVKLQS